MAGLLDSLITSGMLPSGNGVPAAPAPGLLNLNPDDQQDLVIDPTTGVAVRVPKRAQFPAVSGPMQAGVPAMTPSAPLVPSPAFGGLVPATPAPAPQVAEISAAPVPVPMPKPRPAAANAASDDDEEDDETPANAQPTSGQSADLAAPSGSLLDRLGKNLSDNSNLLIGLGAGFAGSPSLGAGISRGLAGASAGSQLDIKQQQQQQAILAQNQTARAFVAKGEDPATAIAAVGNPDLMKALVNKYFGQDKYSFQKVKGPLGEETVQAFNNSTGKPEGGASAPNSAAGMGLLAQGVSQVDPNLSGDAYVSQFSPEIQAAVKNYINGDTMPSGNPRQNSIATFAKTIAQKWGQDTGNPVSDNTFNEKRKMKIDLASSGNSSMGGILSNGESSFAHLAELGDSMADMGNASHNFPGGGQVAAAQNYVGNVIAPSSITKGKVKALNDNLSRYGQESTKFYAGTGGGVEERMNALKEMNPNTTSSEEMAAYMAKEKSLMLDRLNTKFAQMRQTLGEDEANRVIAQKMPSINANIARIDANISKLHGDQPTATAPAATPGGNRTSTGIQWSVVQ